MEKQKRIPKRRFREFLEAGEWEKNTLGDIGRCQSGIGFPDDEQGGRIGIPFYKVSDMNNMGNERVMTNANNYVTCEQIKNNAWHPITDVPAVIFAKVGAAVLLNRKRMVYQSFLIDNNTMAYKLGDRWNDEFCKSLFDTLNFPSLVQVGALPSYNANDVERMEVYLPVLAKEQQKIGDFCRRLDTLISLHQQKLSKLKELKQAYLTEMFPAPGEKRPWRRFKGFSGNWTEKILCHLAEIKDSARVPNNLWTSEGVPYLRSSDLANKGLTGDLYISHHSYEMYKAQTGAPSMGDVLFTSGGQVGITFLKEDDSPLYVQGGAVLYVKTSSSKNLCGQYLKTFFEMNIMQSYMANASVGGTIKHFTVGPASNALITYPSVEEQQLIGDFFKRIDNSLYSCQDKLNKLQSLKQAYLSELFV